MNKAEFVKLLAEKMETSAVNADKNLKLVFETIGEAIAKKTHCRLLDLEHLNLQ